MKFGPTVIWRLLRQTFAEWNEDKAPQLGAALAFYTALSIAPLLIITLGIVGAVYGEQAAQGELDHQMQELVGADAAQALQDMIASADKPTEGTIAAVLGVVTLLFGAAGVFGQLQSSLNTIWEVEPKPGRGWRGMIRDRFLSFAMVLGIAFLLLTSLVLSAALAAMGTLLDDLPGSTQWLAQGVNLGASFLVITLLFAMMFKLLPDVNMAWSDVWLGALVTALLFTIGKAAIGLYLGYSSMASSYGVAGSFVVLLAWVYYSAQILFFGAEMTQVYANKFGSKIAPAENAVRISDEARAQQGRPRRSPQPR